MLENKSVAAMNAEMMAAWSLIRQDHPTDHPANAERLLKEAFTRLNADHNAVVSAENLRQMYAQIR